MWDQELIASMGRKAAYALVDEKLQFLNNSATLCQWLGLPADGLQGEAITDIFPELCNNRQTLTQLFYLEEQVISLSALFRATPDGQSRYFDLQLEPAPHIANALLLVLIDVTPYTQIEPFLDRDNGTNLAARQAELQALEKHNQDLLLLNQAGHALTTILTVQDILALLLEVATQLIGANDGSVWLWEDNASEWLICRAASNEHLFYSLQKQQLHRGQGVIGWVAQHGQSAVVNNAKQDSRFYSRIDNQSGITTNSLLAVPLQIHDDVIGVLVTVNKHEGVFNAHDMTIAENLATSASVAIYNARLVAELQAQKEDLQYRNEELDAFAHTVAHDLKNPLTVLMGFTSLLQREDLNMSSQDRRHVIASLNKNVEKMNTIVQELLLLSSVRKEDVQLQPLYMPNIVSAAAERLAHMFEESQATLMLPEKWPVALGHAPWIEEVWENYLSNAIKYGGNPPYIECGGTQLSNGMIRFWVLDNGQGILPEDKARLFTPFTDLGQAYTEGHGLGLSIVQRIVRKLGGEVGVESKYGQGSIFSFTLPSVNQMVQDHRDGFTGD